MIIRCGGDVEVVSDWTDAEYDPPHLVTEGGTPLGQAVKEMKLNKEKQIIEMLELFI